MRKAIAFVALTLACGSSSGGSPSGSGSGGAMGSSGGGAGGASAGGGGGSTAGSGGGAALGGAGGAGAGGSGGGASGGSSSGGAGGTVPTGTGGAGGNAGRPGTDASADGSRADATGADLGPLPTGTPVVYVGGQEIRIFGLDLATGALTPRATVAAAGGYMAWDASKKHMYSVAGGITAFTIDQRTGGLTRLNSVTVTKDGVTPGGGTTHLSVHPTGKFVFSAYFSSGHVASVALGPDGALGAVADIKRAAAEAHSAWSDPAGKYLFVPCRSGNIVAQYLVGADGVLTPNTPPSVPGHGGPNAGPRHLAFHPTQPWVYVINELGGTTTHYRFEDATGHLVDPATVRNVPMGTNEGSSAHIFVHPNGRYVYTSNRGSNTIGVFSIDQATGSLTLVQNENGGGMVQTPRNFTLDPSGRFAIVANQGGGTVLVFRIDPNDGKLTRVGGAIPGPSGAGFVGVINLP